MSVQLRWTYWDPNAPGARGAPQFSIPIGQPPQLLFKILQYRELLNPLEIGLHEPIYSEWKNVEYLP